MRKQDLGILEILDLTLYPNSVGDNKIAMPTREELDEYAITEDPLSGTIDSEAVLRYLKGKENGKARK